MRVFVAYKLQHHGAGPALFDGIGNAFARDVVHRAVQRLEQRGSASQSKVDFE